MGYYTEYSLDLKNPEKDGIISEIRELNDNISYAISEIGDTNNSTKWYDYRDDMIEISKKYPKTTFVLSGIGEEQPDMWKEYYKNGKYYRDEAIITYPEYDESKLKGE